MFCNPRRQVTPTDSKHYKPPLVTKLGTSIPEGNLLHLLLVKHEVMSEIHLADMFVFSEFLRFV